MNTQLENERYVFFLRHGVLAALTAHVLFLLLFVLLGSRLLVIFNIVSVSIFALCLWLVRRGLITLVLLLATLEIASHAAVAVLEFGWNSGFHYYILTLIMLSAFHPQWPVRGKVAYSTAVCLAYLLLHQWMLEHSPALQIDAVMLTALRWFNTAFTFAFLGYLAHYYAKAARDAEARLEQLASTDSLTGLFNRRHMLSVFKQEQSKMQRGIHPLAIIMIDIDDFKKINDQFGHDYGDEALMAVAACFRRAMRAHDFVSRWGGEEFLMLLPETDLKGAQVLAEKVRSQAAQVPINTRSGVYHITITAAVGELLATEELNKCLARIDQGLLAGKRAGKNRVVVV